MKNIIYYFSILFFVLISSQGCKEGDKKSEEKSSMNADKDISGTTLDVDCSTVGNFLVSPEIAKKMILDFQKIFMRKGMAGEVRGLIDSFWIDACVVDNFQRFLTSNTNYDGLRVYSIAKPFDADSSSDILLVPTMPNSVGHDDKWTTRVPITNCHPTFTNFNLDHQTQVSGWRRLFEKKYRKEQVDGDVSTGLKDSLSRSIWFSRCVLDSLVKYLNNASYRLDGIRVYCGAYDKMYPGSRQLKPIQSTFVIGVTISDGANGHRTNWELLNNFYKDDDKFLRGGYNHGELCPTVCN